MLHSTRGAYFQPCRNLCKRRRCVDFDSVLLSNEEPLRLSHGSSIQQCNFKMRLMAVALNEDVLLLMCQFLPGKDVLNMGGTQRAVWRRTQESRELWRGLCRSLLGETWLLVHETCWSARALDHGTASFFHRLFRSAWSCNNFCYDKRLRKSLLASLSGEGCKAEGVADVMLGASGHTSSAIGPLVLHIGGKWSGATEIMPVTVINYKHQTILEPSLAPGSCRPLQRGWHASCVVRVSKFGSVSAAYPETILITGGYDGNPRSPTSGSPRGGLQQLLFLHVMAEDGSQIMWHEMAASGRAPAHIYHHACGSFAGGRRVCVFGGDMPPSDPEFHRIRFRTRASFVYVLEVDALHWEVVSTTGSAPCWRSFHAATVYTSLADGSDTFVIFGGSDEHCDIFGLGPLSTLRGFALDLNTFRWRTCEDQGRHLDEGSGAEGWLPAGRMRFGAARFGQHMLVHGGRANRRIREIDYVLKFNLRTLVWTRVTFANGPPRREPYCIETGAPEAGCVIGGVRHDFRGMQLVPRLVILRLQDLRSDLHESSDESDANEESNASTEQLDEDED